MLKVCHCSSKLHNIKTTNSNDFAYLKSISLAKIKQILYFNYLTHFSSESRVTHTLEGIVQIYAPFSATRVTWTANALIYFSFTLQTHIARSALARETVDEIETRATILTRLHFAGIDGVLALGTSVAWFALALESVNLVDALSTICTRTAAALVDVDIARRPSPAWIADAGVVE